MCGRYSLTQMSGFKDRFRLRPGEADRIEPLFNIAPTEPAPVVIEENGERKLVPMLFGLIPRWARDAKIASQCINARAETVAEKPAFRDPLRERRCLVISDGYYEWKHEGKARLPYRVVMKDRGLFAFAGLWDRWTSPEGREFRTFSIITTETNGLTAEFHERMPVILKPEDEPVWLAPYVNEPKTVLPLLKPFPPERMDLYPVSQTVNKATNKGPECAAPL
jgi:putative SOS response-associated peptidase YedK